MSSRLGTVCTSIYSHAFELNFSPKASPGVGLWALCSRLGLCSLGSPRGSACAMERIARLPDHLSSKQAGAQGPTSRGLVSVPVPQQDGFAREQNVFYLTGSTSNKWRHVFFFPMACIVSDFQCVQQLWIKTYQSISSSYLSIEIDSLF